MNCASHPDVDERAEIPSAVTMRAFRGGRALPAPRFVPTGPDKPDEWSLTMILERGAYFCPRCVHYQFKDAGHICKKCGRTAKWNPPIFSEHAKDKSALEKQAA